MKKKCGLICTVILLFHIVTSAQDTRAQYPKLLRNAFFSLEVGYINYPFTEKQAEEGTQINGVEVPHAAPKIGLFGYRFNKNLSARITYMRPVYWVRYKTPYPTATHAPVFMNIAGLTLKGDLPISEKLSAYGEGGLGIVTRRGFSVNNTPVVKDANFATVLLGAGLQYHLSEKWSLSASSAYSPKDKKTRQPHTSFIGLGFQYNLSPLKEEKVQANSSDKYVFPKHTIQLGYSSNAAGYGVNTFLSDLSLFWGGDAEVKKGLVVHYRRNVFHTRKLFSLDWGASFSWYKTTKNHEDFFAVSLYPLVRLTPVRTRAADFYMYYSVAGPTFISRWNIDNVNTGKKFTFQDIVGIGSFYGQKRRFNTELSIGHYSNGNLLTSNAGVKVPLTLSFGYTFE